MARCLSNRWTTISGYQDMTDLSPPRPGRPLVGTPKTWVQTDRAAHQAWGRLAIDHPTSAALLHCMVSLMQDRNAVVAPQRLWAEMLGVTDRTVRRALVPLIEGRWVQRVRLGTGNAAAYVVNDRVAWGQARADLPHLSMFTAAVVADIRDQDPADLLDRADLRSIPVIVPPDRPMPVGEGLPGETLPLAGLETPLPRDATAPDPHPASEKQVPDGDASASPTRRQVYRGPVDAEGNPTEINRVAHWRWE